MRQKGRKLNQRGRMSGLPAWAIVGTMGSTLVRKLIM